MARKVETLSRKVLAEAAVRVFNMTVAEADMAALVALALPNNVIGATLGVAEPTVKNTLPKAVDKAGGERGGSQRVYLALAVVLAAIGRDDVLASLKTLSAEVR